MDVSGENDPHRYRAGCLHPDRRSRVDGGGEIRAAFRAILLALRLGPETIAFLIHKDLSVRLNKSAHDCSSRPRRADRAAAAGHGEEGLQLPKLFAPGMTVMLTVAYFSRMMTIC